MKVFICESYGSPDVLKLTEIEKPKPKENEVLIKIKATTVAMADYRLRSFDVPKAFWIPARLILGITKPRKPILGIELSGIIEKIGSKVTKFKVGDEVFASSSKDFGAYAEYKCLPENGAISLKPSNFSFQQSAALCIGASTALHFLRKVEINSSTKILIYGASGSVGTYAVQFSKHFGAEVTAVCSKKNSELVKSLGADKVLDYQNPDFKNQLEKYDIILMAVPKWTFSEANQHLKEDGVFIDITNPFKNLSQIYTSLSSKKKVFMADNVPDIAEKLIELKSYAERGIIKPIIDKIFVFEDLVKAHHYVDKGHKVGNVIIEL